MRIDNKQNGMLNELLMWVKQELLSEEARKNDPVPSFVIDEVTVELSFALTGTVESGINIQVVNLGGEAGEERVQKAIVHMRPILEVDEVVKAYRERRPHVEERLLKESIRTLLRGSVSDEDLPPERE